MIINRIVENCKTKPNKKAVSYLDKSISYKDLANEITLRSKKYETKEIVFTLEESDNFENLLELLAVMLAHKVGILTPIGASADDKLSFKNIIKASLQNSELPKGTFLGVMTSGSSGNPKLIWKDNACWESAFGHQSDVFSISENDTILVLDALVYSANLNAILHGLWLGASVILTPLSKSKNWSEIIDNQLVTSIFLVPSHLELLVKQTVRTKIYSIVTAGEKLSSLLAKNVLEKFNEVRLTEYYGAAELGHISYHQNEEIIENPLTVGKLFPEVKLEIKENQLFVESPYISPQYRNNPTVQDLGMWMGERLCLLGRSGRMFNRRGVNVYAKEIENKALASGFVKKAILFGYKTEAMQSHELYLFFNKSEYLNMETDSLKELDDYLKAVLPPTKRPKKIIEIESFPRLSSGKIDFIKIKNLLQKHLELQIDENLDNRNY